LRRANTLDPDDAADITVWTSIEGNSITIAACIPTLQPLFDLILGRRLFGSTGDRQRQKGYKSHSSGKVELGTIGSKGFRTTRQHRKAGVDSTTFGLNSQESILGPQGWHSVDGPNDFSQEAGICRTQDVTVEYKKVDL